MPFTKELPEWGNAGQRPPQSSIDEGYKPMDHPPADWFNWYQYTAYHALKELQEIGATQDDVSTALKTAKAYTDEFAARRDNPNQVTKGQVGLGNVDNVQQATKAEFNAHNTDSTRHITSTERSNWNAKETTTGAQNKADTAEKNAKTYTDQHINDKSNPHRVTKDQVGLSNVTNDKQATKTEFDAHNYNQIRHISDAERTKWNAAQLSKLTQDNGLMKYLSGVDFNTVIETGFYYMTSVSTALNAPVNSNGYLLVYNYGTYPYQEFTAYTSATTSIPDNRRKFIRNKVSGSENWTPWMEIEYSAGAQAKVNTHENKTDIHVTKEDKNKWNNGQLYPLTTQTGQRIKITKGQNLFDYPTGFYFGAGVVNHPGDDAAAWYYYDITDVPADLAPPQGLKKIVATRSYDNRTWIGTKHKEGEFTGWREVVTDLDFIETPWVNVPYKNGATSGDRPLQYRKVGNTLHLNGHVLTDREVVFASIPSSSAPKKGIVKMVATSGTTGYSKIIIYASGDMKLTGIMATTESKVNGYYIDLVVPLT
ncbi:pyocin knob domain-containing protein [Bacillus subtilis]